MRSHFFMNVYVTSTLINAERAVAHAYSPLGLLDLLNGLRLAVLCKWHTLVRYIMYLANPLGPCSSCSRIFLNGAGTLAHHGGVQRKRTGLVSTHCGALPGACESPRWPCTR
jgi:hypothetical protein